MARTSPLSGAVADALASDSFAGPLDALTDRLARCGYPQSAQRIVTRLYIAEFVPRAPLTQSAIAEKTNLNVATVREQLDRLVDDGYVDRYPNLDDPRERLYRLRSLDVRDVTDSPDAK